MSDIKRKKSLSYPAFRIGDNIVLVQHLLKTFPKTFRLMAQDQYAFYRLPIGWHRLIWDFAAKYEAVLHNMPDLVARDYSLRYMKQKYADLVVSYWPLHEDLSKLTNAVWHQSQRTCEHCGEVADRELRIYPPLDRTDIWGFRQRVCDKHYEIFEKADQ